MKISYVTMGFPAPTETFASNDVKAVQNKDNTVNVYSLRLKQKNHYGMIKERNLVDIDINNLSFLEIFLSPLILLCNPFKTLSLVAWLIKLEKSNLVHLIKCLLLIPSSIQIYNKIKHDLPDIVHLFWGHYPSIVGYLIQRYSPGIAMTTFLGAYDLDINLSISKDVSKKASYVFTHSKSNIAILKSRGIDESKIKLVYRGVDYNFIKECTKKIKKNEKKIVSAGRLIKEKNFDLVISKFAELLKIDNLFTLEIIGSGPERLNLISLCKSLEIEKKVNFVPHSSQVELFKKMASAQYFLFLSQKKSERLSNVIKEAMACKCICICSKTKGINELIINGYNGYILEDSNNLSLRDYFKISSASKKLLLHNADTTIKNNFNIANSHQQYLNVWKNIKIKNGN